MSQGAGYRRDIDGLRALAIVPVVLFHAFPQLLPGGFIGVDIFFVISGYLISGILIHQLRSKRFSLQTFYAHRIRRIFPALITVLVGTFALGWLFAMPDDFKLIGKHMATGAGFVQNFALLAEAGYFDVASETKPLLHLWSLAIEEQFYLVYPLVLWALWRLRASPLLCLGALTAISFVTCLVGTHADPAQAFYLPHTRMWELLAGATLAAQASTAASRTQPSAPGTKHVQSLAGLGLILVGLMTITEGNHFPGWLATLPVVGAVLLIHAGPQAWVNRRVLAHPLATWIGLISYPLYLWHWPLLAYLHITNSASALHCATAVVASTLLAWLTMRLVEGPIRHRQPTALLIGTLASLMVLVGYLGLNTWQREGLPFRFNDEAISGGSSDPERIPHITRACTHAEPASMPLAECWADQRAPAKAVIVGDSKAKALAHGLLEHSTAELPWMFLGGTDARGSLVPVISAHPDRARSQRQVHEALGIIERHPALQVVVIATATRALYHLPREDRIDELASAPMGIEQDTEAGLNRFIGELVRMGKKVVLVVDNPTLKDPRRCMSRRMDLENLRLVTQVDASSKGCAISMSEHARSAQRYTALLERLRDKHPGDVVLFDLPPRLCDQASGTCSHHLAGQPMYSYTDHISNEASRLVSPALNRLIRSQMH